MDQTFNIALGRTVEYYERVRNNDPTNSGLVILPLLQAGIANDATLKDFDDLATLLAGSSNEAANAGYSRKVITAGLSAPTRNDTTNTVTLVIPTQTWTTIAAGGVWAKVLVCYDPDTTGGTDTDLIPLTMHDMFNQYGELVTPNGGDIVWDPSAGFVVAS